MFSQYLIRDFGYAAMVEAATGPCCSLKLRQVVLFVEETRIFFRRAEHDITAEKPRFLMRRVKQELLACLVRKPLEAVANSPLRRSQCKIPSKCVNIHMNAAIPRT